MEIDFLVFLGILCLLILSPIIVIWSLLYLLFTYDLLWITTLCWLVIISLAIYFFTDPESVSAAETFKNFEMIIGYSLELFGFLTTSIIVILPKNIAKFTTVTALTFIVLSGFLLILFFPADSKILFIISVFILSFQIVSLVNISNIWVPTSEDLLLQTEKSFYDLSCKYKVLCSVVKGLGTVEVLSDLNESYAYNLPSSSSSSSSYNNPSASFHETTDDSMPSRDDRGAIKPKAKPKSKPILILVHGYAGANAYWAFCIDRLSEQFKVYCVELPGCGRSTRDPWTSYEVEACLSKFATSIEAWRMQMNIETFSLMGHSLGAHAVSAYASFYPSRVEHLYLVSPVGVGYCDNPSPTFFGSYLAYFIVETFWNSGYFTLDFVRLAGPLGLQAVRAGFRKRISRSHEYSAMRKMPEHMLNVLSDYTYYHWTLPASGERAVNVILLPKAYAKKPLNSWLPPHSYVTESGCIDDDSNSRFNTRRDEVNNSTTSSKYSAIKYKVTMIYGSPSYDWMERKYGDQLAELLRKDGLDAKVFQLEYGGHLLFLEEPQRFCEIVINEYNR